MIKKIASIFIYLSVLLGVLLLVELYNIVPSWLFYAVTAGWLAYAMVAILILRNQDIAYPIALTLAVLTLLVSLPQPEHQNMVTSGFSLGTITFLAGSILQIGVIISVTYYLYHRNNQHRTPQTLST